MEKNYSRLLGLCLIVAACVVAWGDRIWPAAEQTGRYQFGRGNEANVFVIDTQTGQIWQKFISSNSGPSEWTKESVENR